MVNVDFSDKSIEYQLDAERKFLEDFGMAEGGVPLMKYHGLDLVDWPQVKHVLGAGGFDVVLDKSTTDSISTGDDVSFATIAGAEERSHPTLVQLAQERANLSDRVATTQILGTHLASIVKQGGLWFCHSYSASRWDDIIQSPSWPWKQISRTSVPIPSSDPNAPQLSHYIYTIHLKSHLAKSLLICRSETH